MWFSPLVPVLILVPFYLAPLLPSVDVMCRPNGHRLAAGDGGFRRGYQRREGGLLTSSLVFGSSNQSVLWGVSASFNRV